MKLLAIILAIWLQKLVGTIPINQPDSWFKSYQAWLSNRFPRLASRPVVELLLCLAPPLLIVAVLDSIFSSFLFAILFSGILLLWVFGSGGIRDKLATYNGLDKTSKMDYATAHLAVPELAQKPTPDQLHRAVRESLLYTTFSRFFATFLWFAVFGPVGAVLVRLINLYIQNLDDPEQPHICRNLQHVIHWLPLKIHGFAFALVGDFLNTFNQLVRDLTNVSDSNRVQLVRYSFLALNKNQNEDAQTDWGAVEQDIASNDLNQTLSLIERSRLVWLIGLAMLVILGP